MKIALGADHAGFKHKADLIHYLVSLGHDVLDAGTFSEARVDYPDFARTVAEAVRRKKVARGVLVCGSGIGMSIAANKVPGVRAAVVWSAESARFAAEHNDANVLCLGARFFTQTQMRRMLNAWLTASFEGGRHARRVRKISAIENGKCTC